MAASMMSGPMAIGGKPYRGTRRSTRSSRWQFWSVPERGSEMRFQGNLVRAGRHWLARVPIFDAMTQGRSRKEALEMIEDWFVRMIDRKGFALEIHGGLTGDEFEVSSEDARSVVSPLPP